MYFLFLITDNLIWWQIQVTVLVVANDIFYTHEMPTYRTSNFSTFPNQSSRHAVWLISSRHFSTDSFSQEQPAVPFSPNKSCHGRTVNILVEFATFATFRKYETTTNTGYYKFTDNGRVSILLFSIVPVYVEERVPSLIRSIASRN